VYAYYKPTALHSVLLPLFAAYLAFFGAVLLYPKYKSFVNYEIFEEALDILTKLKLKRKDGL